MDDVHLAAYEFMRSDLTVHLQRFSYNSICSSLQCIVSMLWHWSIFLRVSLTVMSLRRQQLLVSILKGDAMMCQPHHGSWLRKPKERPVVCELCKAVCNFHSNFQSVDVRFVSGIDRCWNCSFLSHYTLCTVVHYFHFCRHI